MSGIYGLLGIEDSDRSFRVQNVGAQVVYDAISTLLDTRNAELSKAIGVFVETETDIFKKRYKLPGGGKLQEVGVQSQVAARKRTGQYDVAFPLKEYAAGFGGNRVEMAYMSVEELDNHLKSLFTENDNTVRFLILDRLFNNVQATFVDDLHGSLSIEGLANDDAVVYPPVMGSVTEATEDHYLSSNYVAGDISDTNNPYKTIRDEILHHTGRIQGGNNIAVFIHNDETPETEALTDFDPVSDRFVRDGMDTAIPFGLPAALPGRVIGRTNGVWVVEWDFIPSGWMYGQDLDQPAPLFKRHDPADTGLPRGFALVSDEKGKGPLSGAVWSHRMGFGCGNRLNGVCMELASGTSYTRPTIV